MSHSDLGKAAFAIKDYKTAVDHYSAAIVDDPLHSIHYSNRSLCYLKLEDYTNARDDCLNAISIDPNNTKAWYRHALASISLGDKETAIKDLQQAMTISSDRSIAELLHSIESPRKQTNKTTFHDFIENCEKKKYDKNQIENILNKAEKVLNKRPAVTKVDVDTIRIVGDIHGQFCVIEKIVREHNGPILFNGDLVDRGARGVECFIGIMALISERDDVYINRGNHEDQSINQTFGFETEASSKIGRELFEKITHLYGCLPVCHIINDTIFVVHGGIPSQPLVLHESLIEKKPIYTEDDIELSFLWSDPQLRNGSSPSPRGVGRTFGPDVLNKFLIDNNLKYIVRSHEVKVSGFEWDITGKLLTIFSAPKYGGVNNVGAFADIWFDEESVDILPHFSVQTFCDFDSRDNLI